MARPIDGVFVFRYDGDAHFELWLSRWGRLHAVWVVGRSGPKELDAVDEEVWPVSAEQVRDFFATCEQAGLWDWSDNCAAGVADGAPWRLIAEDGTRQVSCRGNGSTHVPPGFSTVTYALNALTGGKLYASDTWRWGHSSSDPADSPQSPLQLQHPAVLLAALEAARRSRPPRPRLTAIGFVFVFAAVAALMAGGLASLGLGLERRVEQKLFGALLAGGLFLVVVAVAAIFRVFGVRFFRD